MHISAIHCVYFSATYTTSSYLRYIAEGMGIAVTEHDITGPEWANKPMSFGEDELVIFGGPVFGGRIPALAAERFKLFSGKGLAVVVTAYGNRAYDDALLELRDVAEKQGFTVVAAAAPIARHSLLSHHATERPDTDDRAEAIKFGRNILDKINNMPLSNMPKLHVKGNFPYKELGAAAWRPYATDECNACQVCVRRCPTRAISAQTPKATGEACIRCGRCLLICPQKARKIPDPVFAMLREHIDPLCAGRKESEWIL